MELIAEIKSPLSFSWRQFKLIKSLQKSLLTKSLVYAILYIVDEGTRGVRPVHTYDL